MLRIVVAIPVEVFDKPTEDRSRIMAILRKATIEISDIINVSKSDTLKVDDTIILRVLEAPDESIIAAHKAASKAN